MKLVKRMATLFLALILAVGMTSCSSGSNDTTWAIKSGDDVISTELYLSQLFFTFSSLYNDYYSYGYDPTSFFDQTVGGQGMSEYIIDYAQSTSKESLAIRQWMRELGIETSAEELESNQKAAEQSYATNADYLTEMGITREHLLTYYEDDAAFRTLFNYIYGEGGEKGISLDELKNDFYENNYRAEIFYVPLIDSSGNLLSEEEQPAIKDRVDGYVKELNEEGATFASIREKEVKITPSVATTMEDTAGYLSKDDVYEEDLLSTTIANLEEGKAAAFTYNEDYYILTQKMPIRSTETDKHVTDQQFSLRYSMMSEDYLAAIDARVAGMKFDLNDAVLKKYDPKTFVEGISGSSSTTASN